MRGNKGKITVKHYLNKRAKSQIVDSSPFYPVYVQIIVAGHKAQIKSKAPDHCMIYRGLVEKHFKNKKICELICMGYFSEEIFIGMSMNSHPLRSIYTDEVNILTKIIERQHPFRNNDFTLLHFSNLYDAYLKDIFQATQENVKKLYLEELQKLFINSAKIKEDRKLFKLSNYFLHYINWNNSFPDYYENTYEVLPSEIRFLENHFSDELNAKIKAIMALHSREKYLVRYLDKLEKGLFHSTHFTGYQSRSVRRSQGIPR